VWEVLEALAAMHRESAERAPLVTLSLTNGTALTGRIEAVASTTLARRPVVLALADARGARTGQVAFLEFAHVVAVVASDMTALGPRIAPKGEAFAAVQGERAQSLPPRSLPPTPLGERAGTVPPPAPLNPAPPSSLTKHLKEVERRMGDAFEARIELAVDLGALAGDRKALAALSDLVGLTMVQFAAFAKNESARAVIKATLRRIVFGHGSQRSVTRNGGVLEIRQPLDLEKSDRYDARSLEDALNRAI
jgi:hypothetical protein